MVKKTFKCGHPKSKENTYLWRGATSCKECRRLAFRNFYYRNKAKYERIENETQIKPLERKLTPVEMISLLIHEHKKGNDILPMLESLRTQFIEDMLTHAKHSKG